MGPRYHIEGTKEFGYITINRFLYSFYTYMNTVKRLTELYHYASVKFLKGYVAHFCYIRLISFDTFGKVVVEHKDYVTANCILRMLGDCVAIFRLIYLEPDNDLRILRHALYVIDGCERNLVVLPDREVPKGAMPDNESEEVNRITHDSREDRKRLMKEAQEMLDASPLKKKDEKAFNKIVEYRNWKFKEFKDYKKKGSNQYKWSELYELIDECKDFDLLSYFSQYAHGLSMSNLVIQLNEHNINGLMAEATGLIDRLHEYTLDFFKEEQPYILEGYLDPEMRSKVLACFDKKHRPSVDAWNQEVIDKLSQMRYSMMSKN